MWRHAKFILPPSILKSKLPWLSLKLLWTVLSVCTYYPNKHNSHSYFLALFYYWLRILRKWIRVRNMYGIFNSTTVNVNIYCTSVMGKGKGLTYENRTNRWTRITKDPRMDKQRWRWTVTSSIIFHPHTNTRMLINWILSPTCWLLHGVAHFSCFNTSVMFKCDRHLVDVIG